MWAIRHRHEKVKLTLPSMLVTSKLPPGVKQMPLGRTRHGNVSSYAATFPALQLHSTFRCFWIEAQEQVIVTNLFPASESPFSPQFLFSC